MSTEHPRKPSAPQRRDHLEDLLDEADQESFPASDPPAVTPRRGPVDPAPKDAPQGERRGDTGSR